MTQINVWAGSMHTAIAHLLEVSRTPQVIGVPVELASPAGLGGACDCLLIQILRFRLKGLGPPLPPLCKQTLDS